LGCSQDALAAAAPVLIGTRAGGLGWWRARASPLRDAPGAALLRETHRKQVVENALKEGLAVRIITALRDTGVEPILVKGWAVARLYPELGLRPSGDVDLIIPPGQEKAAFAAVEGWESAQTPFDLQYQDYPKLRDRTLDDLYRRSVLVPLEGTNVRILSPEDHLALISVHFLRHGAFRALSLCDIALCVEQAGPDFDWDVCLGHDPLVRNWLTCAIGLAHALLGAEIDHVPDACTLPSWLVPAVLKEWQRPFATQHPDVHEPLSRVVRHPRDLPNALRDRWWGPIRASIWANQPFDESSRLPAQIRRFAGRTAAYGARPFARLTRTHGEIQ
jgi:hypothetical protein